MSNGGLDGAAGGEAAGSLLRNEWLKLARSAGQKLSDDFGKWGRLGSPIKMRDSEAWISGLANMRMLKNRVMRCVSCCDRVKALQTHSPRLIDLLR